MNDIATLNALALALQATFEALQTVAVDIAPGRRAEVDANLRRIQQAKAQVMFRVEELR